MFYFSSLFWLFSVSGLLTIVFKRRFEMVLTVSMILGALLLYLFGFVGHISYGYYLSWLFVVLFWLIVLVYFVKKENDKLRALWSKLFTPGAFIFLVLSVFIFVLYRYQGFVNCDEFTHWGPMLKETLRLDGFYSQDASRLIMHKDYPPFFTLLELLWLGFGGFEYHEGYAYVALVSFMFSMFLPVFAELDVHKGKDWLKMLVMGLGVLFVGLTIDKTLTASDYAFVYNSIYVDWALALFCTYGLFVTYKEVEWGVFRFVQLTLVLMTLVLMKQMGLVYYIIVLLFAFVKVLFIDKKLDLKMFIKGVVFLIIVPLMAYVSWSLVVRRYEIVGQFKIGELSLSDFFSIIRGNTKLQWKYQAFRNYCSNLLKRPLILHPFKMTFFVYVLLMDVLIVFVKRFKRDGFVLAGVYTVGAGGYAVAMLLLYTLAFTVDEAPYLASFDRYMVSYLYCGTTLALMLSFDCFKDYLYQEFMVLVVLLLFVEFDSLNHIEPRFSVVDEPKLTITVVEQFNNGIHFEREAVNGFTLTFDHLGYIDDEKDGFNRFVAALNRNDDLYVLGYDDTILNYWRQLGVEDYLFNEEFYDVDKTNGLSIRWDAYSFVHYVIMYYQLGV